MSNTPNSPGNLSPAAAQAAQDAGATICQSGLPSPDLLHPALRGLKLNDRQWAAIYNAPVFSDQQRSDLKDASVKTSAANLAVNDPKLNLNGRISAQSQAVRASQQESNLRRSVVSELSDEQVRDLAVFVRQQFQPGGPLALNVSEREAFNREMASYDNPNFRKSIGQIAVDAAAIGAQLMGMNTLDKYISTDNKCPQPSPPSGRAR